MKYLPFSDRSMSLHPQTSVFLLCLLAILILGCAPTKSSRKGDVKDSSAIEEPKKSADPLCARCKHKITIQEKPFKQPKKLREFMTKKLNPEITWISFQLFHAEEESGNAEVLPAVGERAAIISKHALELGKLVKGDDSDSKQFRNLAYQLRNASDSLKESALSHNREKTVHWFWHVTDMCLKCHVKYRGY